MLSPIILFVYKRLWHLQQTITSLTNNYQAKESEIYIFSDGPRNKTDNKKVEEIRTYISTLNGFKKINFILRPGHLGLANSVISGVSDIINKYKKVIVVEDDLVTTPNFLTFMNQALDTYKNDKKIFSITGFTYPILIPKTYNEEVYLGYRASSWGWGTWRDRWSIVDWKIKDYEQFITDEDAKDKFARGGEDLFAMLDYQMKGYIDSWAIRWCYAHYKHDAYCLNPTVSKVKNIGLDRSGTHKTKLNLEVILDVSGSESFNLPKHAVPNEEILRNFSLYFKKSTKIKILDKLKELVFYYLKRLNKII